MQKLCQTCGADFKTDNSTSKYCSRECYYNARGRAEVKQCAWCQKEFSNNQRKQAKYCSRQCSFTAQQNGQSNRIYPPKICKGCGKEFRRNGKHVKYCTMECFRENRDIKRKSPPRKTKVVKNWKTIQPAILERDNHTCQMCFCVMSQNTSRACVHHIIDRDHNEPEHLITLCHTCHAEVTIVEQGLIKIETYGFEKLSRFVHKLKDFIK